jgi:hypothetical protein
LGRRPSYHPGERMESGHYRLTREDLEAMRREFGVGRYDEPDEGLDQDLHQIRRAARLGVSPEEWARTRRVPPVYARALRRFIEQG